MTKIRRLSDADIDFLKNAPSMSDCDGCPLYDAETCNCSRPLGILDDCADCDTVTAKAIRIEMEARERDKMEEKKQLPTESELRAELENACDNLNKLWGQNSFRVEKSGNGMLLWHDNGCTVVGAPLVHKFRPDIVPPAKNTVVIVHYAPNHRDGFFNFPVASLGELTENGSVKFQFGPCDCRYARYWYDPQTGNHSADWKMAWIDGVV